MLCITMSPRQGLCRWARVMDCNAGVGSGHTLLAMEVRPWCRHATTREVRAASHTPTEQSLAAHIQQALLSYHLLVGGTSSKCRSLPGHVQTCAE